MTSAVEGEERETVAVWRGAERVWYIEEASEEPESRRETRFVGGGCFT